MKPIRALLAVAVAAAAPGILLFREASDIHAPAQPSVRAAVAELEAYAASRGLALTVRVSEEGAAMLGAYPRSLVLWRLRLGDSAPKEELDRLVKRTMELRPGGVWVTVPTAHGGTRLLSFPPTRDEEQVRERS